MDITQMPIRAKTNPLGDIAISNFGRQIRSNGNGRGGRGGTHGRGGSNLGGGSGFERGRTIALSSIIH
jgi:hypothetical protein